MEEVVGSIPTGSTNIPSPGCSPDEARSGTLLHLVCDHLASITDPARI
jgi:hypothetical protein